MSSTLWDPPTPPTPHPTSPDGPDRPRRRLAVGAAVAALSVGTLLTAAAALPSGRRATADAVVPPSTTAAVPPAPDLSVLSPVTAPARAVTVPSNDEVSPSVLAAAQGAAFAVGLASSSIGIGAAVVRQPDLRTTSSVAAGSAVLQVTLARAAWSAVERPASGRLAQWYEAFDRAVSELEEASDQLTRAIQPSTSDADATTLADDIDRHVDAARAAVADAADVLVNGS